MNFCPACGHRAPAAKFCAECGTAMQPESLLPTEPPLSPDQSGYNAGDCEKEVENQLETRALLTLTFLLGAFAYVGINRALQYERWSLIVPMLSVSIGALLGAQYAGYCTLKSILR